MKKAGPVLTIDLQSLAANYRLIKGRLKPGCRMTAVVKADAYGLGATRATAALNELECNDFFVFTPEEGIALRAAILGATIYILCGYPPGWKDEYVKYNLVPCLSSLGEIERFASNASGRPAAIQFDTGMNRLGLGEAETKTLFEKPEILQAIDLQIIMSHFLAADEAGDPYTALQADRFEKIARHLPQAKKSLSNSAGIFRDADYHHDIVRPGMALYGLNPVPHMTNPMQPVVQLHVPVLQTRQVKKGDIVGYSATYKFEKDTAMATVWLGYADGFLRTLSNRGNLYWKGIACPIRGRVSMDLVTVSLEQVPASDRPHAGDSLEVLGPHQSADDLAALAGTIGYEILTSLGHRYRRVYS